MTGARMALVADGGCRVTDAHDARICNSRVSQSKVRPACLASVGGRGRRSRAAVAMTLGRKQVMEEGGSRVALAERFFLARWHATELVMAELCFLNSLRGVHVRPLSPPSAIKWASSCPSGKLTIPWEMVWKSSGKSK